MTRMEAFETLPDHIWYGRLVGRLTKQEIQMMKDFIVEHDGLNPGQFEQKANELLYLGEKTKNLTLVNEMLCCLNAIVAKEAKCKT